jgi:NADPH:quinone reductase-like Zn-dependent oxidoreductase
LHGYLICEERKLKTVKVVRIHSYGGPDVVHVEDARLPDPKDGEALIRVYAAGVNPVDWKIRAGYLQQFAPLPLPFTLGGDFSGVVERAGAGFQPGDEVYGQASVLSGGSGSFAESCLAPLGTIAAKPRNISHTEAGALPLVGVSAVQALMEHLKIAPGQRVLIHGGAGGIGGVAIQHAKHLGARVATTVSADDINFVRGLGADIVIDYKTQKLEDAVTGVEAVLDTVGGETYARSFRALKNGGRLVSLLERPRPELMTEFGVEASFLFTQISTERLTRLAKLVDQGALRVRVERTFPLQQAPAALLRQEKESPKGKIVLTIV